VRPDRGSLPPADRRGDPYAEGRVVGVFSDLLCANRVDVEHNPVVGFDGGDVADNLDQMLSGDVGTDALESASLVVRRAP